MKVLDAKIERAVGDGVVIEVELAAGNVRGEADVMMISAAAAVLDTKIERAVGDGVVIEVEVAVGNV